MNTSLITTTKSPLYNTFKVLYSNSFPLFEQRTEEHQATALAADNYRLKMYHDSDDFVGFIAYWKFDTYLYIEHFAVSSTLRGKGYGSKLLSDFIAHSEKMVLLEIDPIVDSISAARWRFYKQCGFVRNAHHHTHPPYREGYDSHPLIILTTQREISNKEYAQFNKDLTNIVMTK